MSGRHTLWAVAGLLVGRYGNAAAAQAIANANAAARDGDPPAERFWAGVADALTREAGRNGCHERSPPAGH